MGAIMKKNLIISTLVLAAMCSCTKNDALLPENPQKEISFNAPVVSNITKAVTGEIIEYDTEESFGVFSVYHEDGFSGWDDNASPYINGAKFSYDDSAKDGDSYVDKSGGWTGGYLFPKVGMLSFAAYSPYDAHHEKSVNGTVPAGKGDFSYGDSGLIIEKFSVPSTPAAQYDLMYSNRLYNRTVNMGSQTGYEGMDITFFHALSSIRFTAQLDGTYSSIFTLTSITINGVAYTGDFYENIQNPTTASYSSKPYWMILYNDENVASYTAFNDEYVMTQTQTQVNAYDIILMPQMFKNGSSVINSDAEIVINYSLGGTPQSPTTVKLSDLTTEWEMGKRYTYNITLGYDLILVGATVEKWTENGINTPIS